MLDTGGNEYVAIFDAANSRVAEVADAVGGVAEFPGKGVIDMEANFVAESNTETGREVREECLGEDFGSPRGVGEEVA